MKRTDIPSLVVVAMLCLLIGRHLCALTRRPVKTRPAPAMPVERELVPAAAPAAAVTGAFAPTRTAVAEWPAELPIVSEPVPETGAHVLWLE